MGALWCAGFSVPHDIVRRRKWGSGLHAAYGIQLHDPQLLEYVGAPESARLLSRSPNIASITWVMKRRLRPRSNFNTAPASYSPTCRCCSSSSLPSTGRRRRSSGSHSVGSCFRRMLCNKWCRLTGFVGRHIIWRLWACGGHLILREFGDPCHRRHAMLACCAMTVYRICHSDIRW